MDPLQHARRRRLTATPCHLRVRIGHGGDKRRHTSFWSLAIRERLVAANGSAANQVLFNGGRSPSAVAAAQDLAFERMEAWLTAIGEDGSRATPRRKVLANRPADLADSCWTPGGERIAEPATYPSSGRCGALYPAFGDTRLAAGAPIEDDVLDCTLRPLDFDAYGVEFSEDQRARLRAVFGAGVCDYRRPGAHQQPPAGTWQSYATGPDGR